MASINPQYLAILSLWLAVLALAYIVVRELGIAGVRRRPAAVALLVMALALLPAGGAMKIATPYRKRLIAILTRSRSAAVPPSTACGIFPKNNIWNVPIAGAPVDPNSDAYVASIGTDLPLHGDFSATAGIPYTVVSSGHPQADIEFARGAESDPGPYIVPDDAQVEDGSDAHVLVADMAGCRLYELYGAHRTAPQSWTASSGAIFDLRGNGLRPAGWTSADAAGLPVFPGLLRYDEVAAGAIRHALRFTARVTRRAYVWPARHQASDHNESRLPPMGQRFRLRRSFDESGFSPQARVVVAALKEYGMMLADNGGSWFLTGAPDSRWSSSLRRELARISGSSFEAVDVSSLMLDANSAAAR